MNGEDLEVGMEVNVWISNKSHGKVEILNEGYPCLVDKNSDGILVLVDDLGDWIADIGYEKGGSKID